ncbi:MAG: hypothetical protein K2W82_19135 [Candidatus Obscuribacterales bacterium]|nr:hypothetical protein [Candidatus Obscuribacterales bacterium]
MQSKTLFTNTSVLLANLLLAAPVAFADSLSPGIKDQGKKYSYEKPRVDFYGTGQSGRMSEASDLRFEVEGLLDEGEFLAAIPKAKKAVQLDPGYPEGHILLARALTAKFYQQKGQVDEKLLAECLREWQLIRYHDADLSDQIEAGGQAKRLLKIAKMLEKDRQTKLKEKAEQARIAQKEKGAQSETVEEDENDSADRQVSGKLALKKKRFLVF